MFTLEIIAGIILFIILQFNLSMFFYDGSEFNGTEWLSLGVFSTIFFPIAWLNFICVSIYDWYWGRPIFIKGKCWDSYREACYRAKQGRKQAKKLRGQRKLERYKNLEERWSKF